MPTDFNLGQHDAAQSNSPASATVWPRYKVRRVITVSGRGARGHFPSFKARGRLQFESLVEEDALRVLEMAYATGGRLRALRRLLVRAVEIGALKNSPRIDLAVLAKSFDSVIYRRAPKDRNPFLDAFDGQPLTKQGEPYGPERR